MFHFLNFIYLTIYLEKDFYFIHPYKMQQFVFITTEGILNETRGFYYFVGIHCDLLFVNYISHNYREYILISLMYVSVFGLCCKMMNNLQFCNDFHFKKFVRNYKRI